MNQVGASLAEALVAVTLLSVGLGALSGLTRSSVRALTVARALDRSHALIEGAVDSIIGFGVDGAGTRALPEGVLTWEIPSLPASAGWVRFDHVVLDQSLELHFYTRAER